MATKKPKKVAPKKRAPRKRRPSDRLFESDGEYFLKLVLFVLLGTFWLKFSQPVSWFGLTFAAFPLGLLVGLISVSRFEKFQSDRKIWYAVLLVIGIISYFVPAGIVI